MTVQEAISARHSVRTYLTKPVEPAIVNALRAEIRACNAEGGLHIQLVMNEPMAFRGFLRTTGNSAACATTSCLPENAQRILTSAPAGSANALCCSRRRWGSIPAGWV